VTDDRYDQLKPPNLITALRSFPRRYREALATVPPDPDLLVKPVDGHTVLALLADTAHSIALIDHAVEQTLVHDRPAVDASVVGASARRAPAGSSPAVATLLDELTAHTTALADRLDRAPTAGWSRTADADGHTVRVSDLARTAVRTGAENLRLLERVVQHLPHH
jgi:hypothetical protein